MSNVSPYTAQTGRSRFWRWLRTVAPFPKLLAWCHTTDAFALRAIVETGSFRLALCPVFSEELLYFFYGRPAYRFKDQAALNLTCKAPVVILLAPELLYQGKRMFPFDTGAFSEKRYAAYIHDSMQMSDFELECPSDAPQRHVTSFFGSNIDYLRVRARAPAVGCMGEFEAESMTALLTDRNISAADDRRTALELQSNEVIPFTHPIVRGLIIPDELLKAPFIRKLISSPSFKIDVCTYPLAHMKPAREYQVFLEERAIELQQLWELT